ncbi:TonB-dependent receptor [Steroidobacter sp.]|uniref:TonB-dependent receptor n=1 Tax=Steroidobacter sp. TaxID=1978227 RepID=UPI001A5563A4|nr:TonB-dependent receptor [Steroidobacter sp.]MBL8270873.1 TonB-dependent receptor [Steroidobacter sp.]
MTSSRYQQIEQRRRARMLAASVSGVLLGGAIPGWVLAQDAAEGPQASVLEEVIVTAEKREMDLQRTAIAITALSGDTLEQAAISQPENLNKLVPGLAIGQGGPSSQIYLRGVGSYGTNAFADPAVAFNVDGIYYARVGALGGNFYDLARVEVLKGPQGTLYGRNATGGAVNLIPNRPAHDFSARVGLEVGNYSLKRFNGYVNMPAGDKVAFRLAGQVTDRDGYQSDGYDDDESKSARLTMLAEPNEDLSILLTGSYVSLGGKGAAQLPISASSGYFNNSDPWTGSSVASPGALVAQATRNGQPATLFSNGVIYTDGDIDIEVKSFSAQVDWDLGFSTLTFLGNTMTTDQDSISYGPGFRYQPVEHAEQWSAELRLAGESGIVSWVGGLYAFNDKQDFTFWVDQGFLFNQTGADVDSLKNDSHAVFGELTFALADSTRLKVGARYTEEGKSQSGQIFNRQGATAPCSTLGATPVTIGTIAAVIPGAATNGAGVAYPFTYCRDSLTGDRDWTNTDWKVGLEHDLNDDSMLYATVSTGFKAGGFFATGDHSVVENSYEPEKITAFALGSKNRFAQDRLQLNAEAFFWKYEDHQESYLAPTSPPLQVFGFTTINVPEAEIYGLDLDFTALLTDNDQIGVRAQYLHAEYTDFVFNVSRPGEFQPPPNGSPGTQPPSTVCGVTYVSQGLYSVDCTGQQMPRAPELSLTMDYAHTFKLSGGAAIVPGVRAQYSADYWSSVDYNRLQKQDAYVMWDADLSYFSSNETWNLTAYVNNIGNEDVYSNSFSHPSGLVFNALRPPRTYGLRVGVKF